VISTVAPCLTSSCTVSNRACAFSRKSSISSGVVSKGSGIYVRQNWRSPKLILGGGGLDLLTGVNKCLKMLGFFAHFGTISHGLYLPILRVANLLTAFNKLGDSNECKLC
jgi:hypothetical protein